MSAIKTETLLIGGGVLVVGMLAMKFIPKLGGIFTGNNSLTANAKDASGIPTTAYQGAGVFGTAGAAVNAATGGATASAGAGIGGWLFDLLHTGTDYTSAPTNPAPPSSAAANDKYTQGGNANTGSGGLDMFSDPEGWGSQWGG